MTTLVSCPAPLEALAELSAESLQIADEATFPTVAMQKLRDAGVLRAVLPSRFGGYGIGTEPGRGVDTLAFFHRIGQLSLPLGRLVEAHVNALRIVARYGTQAQMLVVADAALKGDLFALWVTDPLVGPGLTMQSDGGGFRLSGNKMFCSGTGGVQWAVMTAYDPACRDQRLFLLRLEGTERGGPLPFGLTGMRAAATGQVDISGRRIGKENLIGAPGDYLKEPDFSAGAWRSSAVALGGLYQLVVLVREQLLARGRGDDAYQRVRFGQMVTAHETGRLWLGRAGTMAEDLAAPAEEIVATVGLARLAVERACLDGIEMSHRSLGLSAFLANNPVERLTRDLQIYLRQPSPDEVLHNAAGFFLTHNLPKL